MFGSVLNPIIPVAQDGSGASIGYTYDRTPSPGTDQQYVGGTPSVQPASILRAPHWAFKYGEVAWLQGPYQGGRPDLYSWRVKAPGHASSIFPPAETATQIFRNGHVVASGFQLGAPPIPSGGRRL